MPNPFRIDILSHPNSWYFNDLRAAARQQNVDLRLKLFPDIQATFDSTENQNRKRSCDALIVRSMPLGSLEQVIFRMDALRLLELDGISIFNSPVGLETAIDKVLSFVKFEGSKIQIPKTAVFQTAKPAIEYFLHHQPDLVVKPIFGSEGRGLIRVQEEEMAYRVFTALERTNSIIYCQEFLSNIVSDIRVLIVGEEVFSVRRVNPHSWISNAAKGGHTVAYSPTQSEIELAQAAARAVNVEIAGVDLIRTADDKLYVLEVNAVPGWKSLCNSLDVNIAAKIIDYIRHATTQSSNTKSRS